MSATHESNDKPMEEILKDISSGATQLPEFQRGWVWEDSRICALIASITNSYPVGALMFMAYDAGSTRFKCRAFTGVQTARTPDALVLDGQQRLTSIFCAMFCRDAVETKDDKGKKIKRFYYLDIKKCLDKDADRLEDGVISLPDDRQRKEDFGREVVFDVSTREKEFAAHVFPLNIAYDWSAVSEWRTGYQEYHADFDTIKLWNRFESEILMPVYKYKVPVIKLGKDTPKEAVCQVFENVNKGGVTLTVFELVTATFASDDFDLRKDWEARKAKMGAEPTKWLGKAVDNDAFLTAMTLLTRYKAFVGGDDCKGPAVSCKRVDVLKLNLADYTANADALTDGFIQAARFLMEQRVFSDRDLPYATQLIPLSALFAVLKGRSQDGTVRNKLARWYWCGVFGEMYGAANETRYANDITGFMKWLDDDESLPETVSRANFYPTRLLSLQMRNSAAYKGVMALLLKAKALDFISGKEMDFTVFSEENIDIHHIFPKAYCEGENYPWQKWNSVVNKTPLSERTNRVIGGHAPSKYLAQIVKGKNVAEEDLDKALRPHLIDVGDIRADEFDAYFIKRAKALLELIGEAMGKAVQNLSGEDVVKEFGRALE